jgi:hypothetical protein
MELKMLDCIKENFLTILVTKSKLLKRYTDHAHEIKHITRCLYTQMPQWYNKYTILTILRDFTSTEKFIW